jgi:hypothetical protein
MYTCVNPLTRTLLEEPTVAQLFKKFCAFHEILRSIAVFTRARQRRERHNFRTFVNKMLRTKLLVRVIVLVMCMYS